MPASAIRRHPDPQRPPRRQSLRALCPDQRSPCASGPAPRSRCLDRSGWHAPIRRPARPVAPTTAMIFFSLMANPSPHSDLKPQIANSIMLLPSLLILPPPKGVGWWLCCDLRWCLILRVLSNDGGDGVLSATCCRLSRITLVDQVRSSLSAAIGDGETHCSKLRSLILVSDVTESDGLARAAIGPRCSRILSIA